jgi:3-deoxy-manno-octulosonate cytidylyltransferase (CMP-KDO synthetase)
MNIVAIVPARMGSSRFPGKPMAEILGLPMIAHVYLRTAMSKTLNETWVATCDQEIKDYIESIGGKAIMTADTHERCSDRTAEAMVKIEGITGKKIDVVVMVQGDEPLVTPGMIDSAVETLKNNKDAGVACLMNNIEDEEDFSDPNEVKVVVNGSNRAIYFSREPIPTMRKGMTDGPKLKQVCIIPFTRDYLLQFNTMPPSQLEIIESIDLNRCLEYGHVVQMAFSPDPTVSVDTKDDLAYCESVMASRDELHKTYVAEYANKTRQRA